MCPHIHIILYKFIDIHVVCVCVHVCPVVFSFFTWRSDGPVSLPCDLKRVTQLEPYFLTCTIGRKMST